MSMTLLRLPVCTCPQQISAINIAYFFPALYTSLISITLTHLFVLHPLLHSTATCLLPWLLSTLFSQQTDDMVFTLFIPFLLNFVAGQTNTPQCAALSFQTTPPHTMQFTPSMPTQIPPVSTVYGAILTKHLNVSK